MSLRVGVLADPFDPVRAAHSDLCRSVLSRGEADQIFLIPFGIEDTCAASQEDRWRMLVSACAGSKVILPVRVPAKKKSSGRDGILYFLQKKYPDHRFFLIPSPLFPAISADVFASENDTDILPPSVLEYCSVKKLYGASSRLVNAGSWIDRLFEDLNPHRFSHSLSVARTSVQLALRYGINLIQAEEAGLLHDCAKCIPLTEMRRISERHGLTEDPVFLGSGSLLHSIVGSWLARSRYGVADPEILKAIEYHNTGYPGMSRLAMCVCLADFIEPNRDPFPLLEEVRRLSAFSLEKALLLSLEGVMSHVSSKGKTLHPRTVKTVDWLRSLPDVRSAPGFPERSL